MTIITLKFLRRFADDGIVIEPIQIPEVLRIPDKGSMGNRQPPPRKQPPRQPQSDHTPPATLYRPDGAIDGAGDDDGTSHIDVVG